MDGRSDAAIRTGGSGTVIARASGSVRTEVPDVIGGSTTIRPATFVGPAVVGLVVGVLVP